LRICAISKCAVIAQTGLRIYERALKENSLGKEARNEVFLNAPIAQIAQVACLIPSPSSILFSGNAEKVPFYE
jgi:hypothetical protein